MSCRYQQCKSLQQIVIPDSVTEIDYSAFKGCTSLQQIVIPDSVTEIGENAFNGCTSLQQIVIPDSVTKIGKNAFWRCISVVHSKMIFLICYLLDYQQVHENTDVSIILLGDKKEPTK